MKKSTLTLAATATILGQALPQQTSAAGFIEDSTAKLTFKNFYINQDDRDADRPRAEEWGQAFLFEYKSGFTEGTVGFGLDLIAQEGIKLDSGGDRNKANRNDQTRLPSTMFPLDNGKAADDFGRLNGTLKMRISKTIAEAGVLRPKLPVVVTNDGRLLPQLYHGAQVTSKEFDDLTFIVGKLERATGRTSTDSNPLAIARERSSDDASSNKFYYGGVDYNVTKDLKLQYYFGNLEDFYEQHFVGLVHNWALPVGALKTDLRVWNSDSSGANSRRSGRAEGYTASGYWASGENDSDFGEVDNNVWSAQFTYSLGHHQMTAGYQSVTGDSDFPVLNQGDGISVPLITNAMTEKFMRAGEKTWLAGYAYDFAGLGIDGLKASLTYYSGDDIDQKSSDGEDQEWERDFRVDYVVPVGTLKGLGLTWRSTAVRGYRERDDNRLYVTYTWNML